MSYGHFITDEAGLPAYCYSPERSQATDNAPCFLQGNHRLTVFTCIDGRYRILAGERAWAQINFSETQEYPAHCTLSVDGKEAVEITELDLINAASARRVFGCGYASLELEHAGISLSRTLSVPPHTDSGNAIPGVLIRLSLTNSSDQSRCVSLQEALRCDHRMLLHRHFDEKDLPLRFTREIRNHDDQALSVHYNPQTTDPHLLRARHLPALFDAFAPSVHLKVAGSPNATVTLTAASENGWTEATLSATLDPGASTTMDLMLALDYHSEQSDSTHPTAALQTLAASAPLPFLQQWREKLPDFSSEHDPALARELTWHAYCLEAMATYHECYAETHIPQGGAYDYVPGTSAAPRDHLQHLLGVLGFDTSLAKSALRNVLQKVGLSGEIAYTETAVLQTSNQMWHTSDQQLYLFYAIATYLRETQDYAFLNETVRYHPIESGVHGTVLEHLERSFIYLRDEVGTGLHGLPRIMNSDWNDGIFYSLPTRNHFYVASSHLNASMALVVLEQLLEQFTNASDNAALAQKPSAELIHSIRHYRKTLLKAFMRDMEGRDFSRRAYLGDGMVLGENNLYLEPQMWLMQLSEFPIERKQRLWQCIQERLLQGEALGCRQLEHGEAANAHFSPGEGENGAFWYALQGPLILGLASFDREAAYRLLRKMSLASFSEHYPNLWHGQWSAPDTVNSSLALVSGSVNQDFEALVRFPSHCAHIHAWMLFAAQQLSSAHVETQSANQRH